jgi:hypothetical protein
LEFLVAFRNKRSFLAGQGFPPAKYPWLTFVYHTKQPSASRQWLPVNNHHRKFTSGLSQQLPWLLLLFIISFLVCCGLTAVRRVAESFLSPSPPEIQANFSLMVADGYNII